jgi:hypothetical protein
MRIIHTIHISLSLNNYAILMGDEIHHAERDGHSGHHAPRDGIVTPDA